jgi:hypothetical protein
LSNDASLPQSVRDYVVHKQQVDNALVATVGGPAVPSYPEADVAISGADRYQTAALVADLFFVLPGSEGPAVAGLATGANFPDALSGGAVMALIGGPMLLTNPPPSTDARRRSLPRTGSRSTPLSSSAAVAPSPTSSTGKSQRYRGLSTAPVRDRGDLVAQCEQDRSMRTHHGPVEGLDDMGAGPAASCC